MGTNRIRMIARTLVKRNLKLFFENNQLNTEESRIRQRVSTREMKRALSGLNLKPPRNSKRKAAR